MDDDRIRDALGRAAHGIEVGDTVGALSGVHALRRGRRRRRAVLGGVAAAALFVGGVAVVTTRTGSDGDDVIRSATPPSSAPPTTIGLAPGDEATADASPPTETADAPVAEGPATSSAEGTPVSLPSVGDAGGQALVEWLVPWEDGFLAGATIYQPQALPTEFPPEIAELFPPEVSELFADEWPATIDEAIARLTEAGLYDAVAQVVTEHPEASEAIYASPAPKPQAVVQFTTDGDEWTPVDVTLPAGIGSLSLVAVARDRLVVVGAPYDRSPGTVTVATSTDLTTWETQEIDIDQPAEAPDAVTFSVWPSGLAANEAGWVLSVNVDAFFDPTSFLPGETAERMAATGGGFSTSDVGIEVQLDSEEGTDRHEYTWAELGVDESIIEYVNGTGHSEVWASPFDGVPVRSDLDGEYANNLVATPDRFLLSGPGLSTSTDGLTWTAVETPFDDYYPSAVTTSSAGTVFFTSGPAGEGATYLVDPSLTTWTPVEIPGGPEENSSVFNGVSAAGAPAVVVDASPPRYFDQTVTLEAPGYIATQSNDGPVVSYELVDLASGEVVLAESVDLREVDGANLETGPFEHVIQSDGGGMTFLDPETGEVLVVIPQATIDQAYTELFEQQGDPPAHTPDFWLIAYQGSGEWLVDDLPEPDGEEALYQQTHVALNGDTLLVGAGGGWLRYDVAS